MEKQLKKQFDEILCEYGEPVFRCAVTHMTGIGTNHLTPEAVTRGVEQMRQAEKERLENKPGGVPIMTVEFQIDILECAGKLAEHDIWDLLRYIKAFISIG